MYIHVRTQDNAGMHVCWLCNLVHEGSNASVHDILTARVLQDSRVIEQRQLDAELERAGQQEQEEGHGSQEGDTEQPQADQDKGDPMQGDEEEDTRAAG